MLTSFFKTSSASIITAIIGRIYEAFRYKVSLHNRAAATKKLKHYFSGLEVQNGIMKGLRYPSFISFGSSLFPKLGGTYEVELESVFMSFVKNEYKTIIDIGCAEGYYAVGLAKLFPSCQVLAFDIDETARSMCESMAILNQVKDRIQIEEKCTPELINQFPSEVRALIICDCEGYERHLFNSNNINVLKCTDLIIELHPMYEPDVKNYLHNLFKDSHHIRYISSHDDNRKIVDLNKQYENFLDLEKLLLVQEGRPYTMDWLILTPKVYI
jgi:hypothetical protein